MPHTYILHSNALDKYYIGSTSGTVEDRLRKHLTNHDGFTSRATDWEIAFQENFEAVSEAKKFENKIKKAKSRKYIESLIARIGEDKPL